MVEIFLPDLKFEKIEGQHKNRTQQDTLDF
jgi:hypothetical protein